MKHDGIRSLRDRIAPALLMGACLGLVGIFLVVSLLRIRYPFELEWLEGLTVDYARRIHAGRSIYGPPDATFAPAFYPPLFYLLSLPALIASKWALAGPRLLSWACVIGAGALSVRVLRRAGASWPACGVALGVQAFFYPKTFYWYELARVDSLQTFLLIAGISLLSANGARPARGPTVAAAGLLAAAVFTKQTAVFVCAASVGYFAITRAWRTCLLLGGAMLFFGLPATAALWLWSRDAFEYLFAMPARHHVSLSAGIARSAEFARQSWPFVLLALCGPWGATRERRAEVALFGAGLAGALAAAALAFSKIGGQTNSAMPAIFLLGIAAGFGADAAWRALDRGAAARALRAAGALGLTLFLSAGFREDVAGWVPGEHAREVARELLADMRRERGPFLPYNHSFISTVLRGESYPYGDRLYDYAGGFDQQSLWFPTEDRYPRAFLDRVRKQRFTAIYRSVGGYPRDPVDREIAEHYRVERLFAPDLFWLGERGARWKRCLPREKWVPRRDPPPVLRAPGSLR
jgi:hypothetical protein